MRVTSLKLQNFRSFAGTETIVLDQINVFVGANNTGKSTILKALNLIQEGCYVGSSDIRAGASEARIDIGLESFEDFYKVPAAPQHARTNPFLRVRVQPSATPIAAIELILSFNGGHAREDAQLIVGREPLHFIIPFLSKRKTTTYQEDVRDHQVLTIHPDMSFLAAKVSRVSSSTFPGHKYYNDACEEILGFPMGVVPAENGQRVGIYVSHAQRMFIDQMGEGVANIVALLAELTVSRGKLFLIEEPENDLHPKALKALLDLILESSKENQFVISTHSNIVVRHLAGQANSLLYKVASNPRELPPSAKITEVDQTPEARLEVLRDLGYSFSDFELWDGWLILEESSAEIIIRDYLIPMFAPRLTRVRTLAAGGNSKVEPVFEDLRRLVLFTHLERAYRDAAWVRIDGDTEGEQIVKKLKGTYSDWSDDRFACFQQEQFEHYYPAEFKDTVGATLSITDKKQRKDAKRTLLLDVRKWLDADRGRAELALRESAAEIILDLQTIESQLCGLRIK